MMNSLTGSASSTPKVKSHRYSKGQWEAQKNSVERLYIIEDRPAKEVIQILEQEVGFKVSEKQLKARLTKWKFDIKNIKGETMIQIARTKEKRKLENKDSSFRVCKKPVDNRKIDRFITRGEYSAEQLLSMASPTNVPSPAFSVFTPQSVLSPVPGVDSSDRSARSPTPGLNFQALTIVDSQPPVQFDPLSTISEEMIAGDHSSRGSSSTPVLQIDKKSSLHTSTMYLNSIAERAVMLELQDSPKLTNTTERDPTTSANGICESSPSAAPATEERAAIFVKDPRPWYLGDWMWTCCFCKMEGDMAVEMTMHGPDVKYHHLRCHMCHAELITMVEFI